MACFFVILILTEPRFGSSAVLNPFLYARYIIDAAPTEFFIVNFHSGYNRVDGRRDARKRSQSRCTRTFDLATRITYYHGSTIDVTTELQLLASELDRMRLQVKSIKDSRFSLCMRMKAAITKQQCMQCHIECCWETASRIKMST